MDHPHAPNKFAVLSTPDRVASPHDLAGRGVTIALLDSGFTAHPDLTMPVNRIVAYHDVHDPERGLDPTRAPEADEWHGTQTAVVAAGNGFLSDGAYRGLASEATRLVIGEARRQRRHRYLHAFPSVENAPSNAICRKLGFELMGEFDFEYPPGRPMRCNDWRLELG